jgi:type IV pilus assembly protein PilC
MAKLFYIARDKAGNKVTGTEENVNQEELVSRLQAKELVVVKIAAEGAPEFKEGQKTGVRYVRRHHHGISGNDLVLMCRQLATLLSAGVAILKSLDIISEQVASTKLRAIIKKLIKDMEQGLTFHESMAKYPTVFSDLWINLVESGEASGNLAVVLDRLAYYLEREAEFKKRIISSLIYPAILLCAGLGALLFLTIKIIPTFAEIFKGFNITLPLITRILIALSEVLRKFILIGTGGIICAIYMVRKYIQTKDGRKKYENIKFNLPMFGDFFKALIVERFSSGMSTLLESGVPILYSLEITEHSVGNLIMTDIIREVKDNVRNGRPLSQTLEKSKFFEPMVVQMISIGEEIGELPDMFKRINKFYQDYLETFLSRFTSMFEPIMLIFMGGVIGIMVIGMFLPIFQITQISG